MIDDVDTLQHHCRNCGYVVCGDCSKNKYLLQSQSDEPLRVCNQCYEMLTKSSLKDTTNNNTNGSNHGSANKSYQGKLNYHLIGSYF